jgi:hypothetical protein
VGEKKGWRRASLAAWPLRLGFCDEFCLVFHESYLSIHVDWSNVWSNDRTGLGIIRSQDHNRVRLGASLKLCVRLLRGHEQF